MEPRSYTVNNGKLTGLQKNYNYHNMGDEEERKPECRMTETEPECEEDEQLYIYEDDDEEKGPTSWDLPTGRRMQGGTNIQRLERRRRPQI